MLNTNTASYFTPERKTRCKTMADINIKQIKKLFYDGVQIDTDGEYFMQKLVHHKGKYYARFSIEGEAAKTWEWNGDILKPVILPLGFGQDEKLLSGGKVLYSYP